MIMIVMMALVNMAEGRGSESRRVSLQETQDGDGRGRVVLALGWLAEVESEGRKEENQNRLHHISRRR